MEQESLESIGKHRDKRAIVFGITLFTGGIVPVSNHYMFDKSNISFQSLHVRKVKYLLIEQQYTNENTKSTNKQKENSRTNKQWNRPCV
jgi:hypothetical protein